MKTIGQDVQSTIQTYAGYMSGAVKLQNELDALGVSEQAGWAYLSLFPDEEPRAIISFHEPERAMDLILRLLEKKWRLEKVDDARGSRMILTGEGMVIELNVPKGALTIPVGAAR